MQQNRHTPPTALAAIALMAVAALFLLLLAPTEAAPARDDAAPAAWEVIADGLANPRHLKFGPDGALYVAEAGSGGDGTCVTGPEGEVCLGETGAISKVTFDAAMMPTAQEQVITGVVSLGAKDTGDSATGPHDLAFDSGGDLYFLTGLGADPAVRDITGPFLGDGQYFAQLMSTGPGDAFAPWSDIGGHEATENPDGGEPDTNPYGMTAIGDDFAVVDAGGNSLLGVAGGTGDIDTVAVFPDRMIGAISVQAVPTSVVVGPDGAQYVGQLTGGPFIPGAANVWRVAPGGDPEVYAEGFTNILDLDFAADGSLYVLEMFTRGINSGDPTGAVTRIDPDGSRTVVAREGLITPTGLTVGPDHALYVSNFGTSATAGQVVRIPTRLSEAANFAAILSGDEEVPPVVTEASGVGRFALAEDGTLSWEVAVRDIAGITAAHIHKGAPGVSGPPVITLFPSGGDPFDPENPISGSAMLTPDQIADLLAGNYYVNVHTPEHPAGEIRGQIEVARTWAFAAMLSGANEVEPVDSEGSGQALLTLSADMSELHYRLFVNDLDDVTMAHIHEAPAGSNGDVVFPLFTGGLPPLVEGSPVADTLAPSIDQVAALLAGDYYVNVHTSTVPSGEIRGQLAGATPRSDYHALLSGAEENPVVDTGAAGVATFALSADLSTLDYHLAVSEIDNVTMAHLHTGWPGANGAPVHTLFAGGPPPLEPGSPANGLLALDAQSVLDLWSGYYYANVHSSDYPTGEIRGQVEGASLFHAELNGDNVETPVDTEASGHAVLALSDDASMLYYRVMVSDIEDITLAHIHKGAPGASGPPVITLYDGTGDFDPDHPISGSAPMTDDLIFDLIAGNHYINVHTEANPGGEIRGQVWPMDAPAHFSAALDGDQEVPPVVTDATGQGHFTLDGGRNTFHYHVAVADIDNVNAAHIHKGSVGVNGPPVFTLFNGGTFDPDHPVGGGVWLNAENLVDLLTGYTYVNVHTTDFPDGEIRGQIGAVAEVHTAFLPVVVHIPVE